MVDDNKKSENFSSDDNSQGSMVGVNYLFYSTSVRMDQTVSRSLNSDFNENKVNGNTPMKPPTPPTPTNNKDDDRKNERCFSESPKHSSLTEVNRPSPNCGVFDYKHHDTDSEDQNSVNENSNLDVSYNDVKSQKKSGSWKMPRNFRTPTVCRKMDFADDEEVDHEALQKIIDSAILDPNWLISNISSDSEGSILDELEHPPSFVQESMDTGSEENISQSYKGEIEPKETKNEERVSHEVACSKESIHRLISNVDHLVKEVPIAEPTSLSPRSMLKPLPFGMPGANKQRRIKEWLDSQKEGHKTSAIINTLQDSCDASGELTTGESDLESDSSNQDLDVSSTTQRGSGDPLFSSENTPTVEGLPVLISSESTSKVVVMRGKKRHQHEQRPWSVSDPNQITRGGNVVTPQRNADKVVSMPKAIRVKSILSSSESALNRMTSFPCTPSNGSNNCSISHSDPSVASKKFSTASCSFSPPTPLSLPQSPTITSSSCLIPSASVPNGGSVSPVSIAAGSLRKRRAKFRRRSNQFLGRLADSGSEEINMVKITRSKESKPLIYSPYYHSLTKSLSSESEYVSGCPRVVKSSSFSGVGYSGAVTSSTERYLSDSSVVSGIPRAIPPEIPEAKKPVGQITSTSVNTSPAITPRQGLNGDQEVTLISEDVSSLSEQAWDPYQEFKYLSEPYSEDLDRDGARRLLDFGDDYRKYIDSDGSSLLLPPHRRRRSPHHRKIRIHSSYRNLDSDSDLDDLHHVIEESKSQLNAMESVLQKYSNGATLGLDFGELVATTNTNLKCLKEILKHLEMEAPDLQSEFHEVQGIVQRWETLQSKALERQRQSNQLRQLQRQVKNLRLNIEEISSRSGTLGHLHVLDNPSQFSEKVEEAKALVGEMDNLKVELSSLNLLVHRFTTEVGQTQIPLKDDMAELYRLWDEVYRRVNGEVSRLQGAEATWRLWEEQKMELSEALKQDSDTLKVLDAAIHDGKLTETVTASVHDVAKLLNERRIPGGSKCNFNFPLPKHQSSNTQIPVPGETGLRNPNDASNILLFDVKEDRLSDSGTSGYESCSSDDLSERERRLAYLRRLARDLEASLEPGSKAWNEINMTLAKAEKELKGLQDHCRNLILRTAESLDQNPSPSRFTSTSSKRRPWARESKSCRSPRQERRTNNVRSVGAIGGGCRRDWISRVVRAALPFQAAFLLLVCVAYLLEPSCCDSVNTLNLSFSPQLRYVPGSPPV